MESSSAHALRASQARLAAIFSQAAVGLTELSLEGRFVMVNDTICEMLGRSRSELLQMDASAVTHPDDRAHTHAALERLLEEGENISLDKRYVRADGSLIRANSILTLLKQPDGRPGSILVVTIDLTARLEKELQLRRARDELEDAVRLRTLELEQRATQLARLTSELTVAEQRERHRIAQVLHDHLQQLLVSAVIRLDTLASRTPELRDSLSSIQKLIEEANAESRSLTAELSPPILHDGGIAAGLQWLARWMKEKHELDVTVTAPHSETVEREDVLILLFHAVRELLLNVVKHSGVRHADVVLKRIDSHHLQVTVADKGRGCSLEEIEAAKHSRDSGFGLFSIRERLNHLGGSLRVDSAPGQGATFRLLAPADKVAPVQEAPPYDAGTRRDTGSQNTGPRSGRLRVLLADDHATLREGLCALINGEDDLEVVGQASDGEEAVIEARRLHPDILVMDYSMPKLDGVAAIRQVHGEQPNLPIIGLSMYEEEEAAAAMREAGAAVYLTKSGRPERLLQAIRQLSPVCI